MLSETSPLIRTKSTVFRRFWRQLYKISLSSVPAAMSDIGKRCRLGSVEECVWGLESCPICVGNLEAMQVVQLSAAASSQWEEELSLIHI